MNVFIIEHATKDFRGGWQTEIRNAFSTLQGAEEQLKAYFDTCNSEVNQQHGYRAVHCIGEPHKFFSQFRGENEAFYSTHEQFCIKEIEVQE